MTPTDISEFEAALASEIRKSTSQTRPTVKPENKPPRPEKGIKHVLKVFKHFPDHPYEFTHVSKKLSSLEAEIDARKAARKEGCTVLEVLSVVRNT